MDKIREKLDEVKGKSYRGKAIGVHVSFRIPPIIMEGVLAFMKENGSKDMSDAIVELIQEGIIGAGTK